MRRFFSSVVPNRFFSSSFRLDLRSDTATVPSREMKLAAMEAVLGDEQEEEDPTTLALENEVATLFGKEAGAFVISGTMGNLTSVMGHCLARGSQMFVGDRSHAYLWEQGNCSSIAGVHQRVIPNLQDGQLCFESLAGAVNSEEMKRDPHFPVQQLIVLENTHNRCGGVALPAAHVDQIGTFAHSKGMKLHIDGARILNAATALQVSPALLVAQADSVSLCLSKGLGCPAGGVVVGSSSFISRVKRAKKALGGTMRQSGFLAATGRFALGTWQVDLQADHDNAKWLAQELQTIQGLQVTSPCTNTIFLQCDADNNSTTTSSRGEGEKGVRGGVYSSSGVDTVATGLVDLWGRNGVLVSMFSPTLIRVVTHRCTPRDALQEAVRHIVEVTPPYLDQARKSMQAA